jgi:hypothetical protein
LISYFPATTSPAESDATNEYSCPHFRQNPESRFSAASHPEQNRFRSGTVGATSDASGSSGGNGGLASGRPPSARDEPVRPVRVEPERVDRVLRPLRVDGVRPEPVRAEAGAERPVLVVPLVRGTPVFDVPPAGAIPHTSQYPSSIEPEQPDCAHAAIRRG